MTRNIQRKRSEVLGVPDISCSVRQGGREIFYTTYIKKFKESDVVRFYERGRFIECTITRVGNSLTFGGRPMIKESGKYNPWPTIVK